MLLCDHIIFWTQHNDLPGFTSEHDMILYEIGCSIQQVADGMKRMIARMPAVAETFKRLADTLEGLERL